MAKAAELNINLNEVAHVPSAATASRVPKERRKLKPPEPPKNDTPVNFRWPAAEVKAMKRAALEADMTIQDFLLSCFRSVLQKGK